MREILPVLIAGIVPIALLTLIVTGTALNLVAWQPPILQTTRFGTNNSANGVTAISSDSTGVYAAGFVGYSDVTPTYLFVNKYDLSGRQVWTQHFGDVCCSQISGIAEGGGGEFTLQVI